MMVTRESLGTISFSSSSCLPLISGARADNPVMFPPGCARLATNPLPTGSVSCAMTIGIVEVASFTTRVSVGPGETMTSTLRRTSSAASSGRRSNFPSANRHSMTMFLPSSYPSSRSPWRNASVRAINAEAGVSSSNPIRGTFAGCCASARMPGARSVVQRANEKMLAIENPKSKIQNCFIESPCSLLPAHWAES